MRMLRYLFAIALVFGLSSAAKAAGGNFQMVVVDPTVPFDVIQPVYTDTFALTFPTSGPAAGCDAPGQLPSSLPDPGDFVDCFTGINLTGNPLTALEIEFATTPLGSAQPNCPTLTSDGDFPDVTCSIVNGGADYLFDFTGGNIPAATLSNSPCYFNPNSSPGNDCDSPAVFTIAIGNVQGNPPIVTEDVVQQIDTNGVSVIANAPEPSPILLMSTGILSIGFFGVCRRRQTLAAARPPSPI